tara:strand:+ start:17602 stop:17787 length:186 start_codon:yes stop_codon:yes gene_type:complete
MKLLVTYNEEQTEITNVQEKPLDGVIISGLDIITGTKENLIFSFGQQGYDTTLIEEFNNEV